jgi:dephospho-CoA kinase
MPALAITGNIGSGKSAALKFLSLILAPMAPEIICFSADKENRRLLDEDREVREEIRSQLGTDCYLADGTADRMRIFRIITSNSLAKKKLESILHPRLERLWKPLAEQFRMEKERFFIAEIPLLYEKELETFFNRTLLIGCSVGIRRGRLEQHRSITSSDASRWDNLQHSQESKFPKADHLLWNDGSQQIMTLQLRHFVSTLSLK